jgi:hypothetical protein
MFLYIEPTYFGNYTIGISIASFIIGLIGLGTELEKLSTKQDNLLGDYKPGSGIYNNFFYGTAIFIAWFAIHNYYKGIIINILATPLLLFGIYPILLGLSRGLLEYTYNQRSLEEQRISVEANADNKDALIQINATKYYLFIRNVLVFVLGLTSFIAAILQILQILKYLE